MEEKKEDVKKERETERKRKRRKRREKKKSKKYHLSSAISPEFLAAHADEFHPDANTVTVKLALPGDDKRVDLGVTLAPGNAEVIEAMREAATDASNMKQNLMRVGAVVDQISDFNCQLRRAGVRMGMELVLVNGQDAREAPFNKIVRFFRARALCDGAMITFRTKGCGLFIPHFIDPSIRAALEIQRFIR